MHPREDRDPGSPSPAGDRVDRRSGEGSDGRGGSDGAGGTVGSRRACHCGLDDCPHDRELSARQRIEFDEDLLQRMMEGRNPRLLTPRKERQRRDTAGKRGTARTELTRGRYIRAVHAGPRGRDVALDATIRTAALHPERREPGGLAVQVEPSDLHAKVRERKVGTLLLFVVDCSGSMGTQRRLLATQGAILCLLVDAYQHRDRVGLVTFREESADVLLRPTSSVELAKRAFQSLATGGPTPLSRGLLAGYELIRQERRKEQRLNPVLILISDGWANVSMGDIPPVQEATLLGAIIRTGRIRSLVLGTAGQGWRMGDGRVFAPAEELAVAMGGEFHPMDEISAARILEAIDRDRYNDD